MNQHDVIDAFKPDLSRKHGCAWFIWPSDTAVRQPEKTGGWASIGGDPAFQFASPKDLPKDVIWWTNLSKPEAWSLGHWSHIKHAGFLGPHWLALMSEWGFVNELDDLKMACSAWSEVLARLGNFLSRWSARLAQDNAGEESVSPLWSWGDGDFHEVLAEKLNWNTSRSEAHPVLEVAFCDHIENEVPSNALNNKRKMTMTLPRAEHARRILSTRYPVGEFTEVPLAEWPQETERRWDWVNKQTLPVLLRFDDLLFRAGLENEAQLWWGLRGRRFAGAMMEPVWLTAEEALEMNAHTDATPSVALRAKGWTRMNDVPHWPKHEGFAYDNSIVAGLLNEALWRAASTPVRTPTKRIKSGVSSRAVWWRSADRRACYQVALDFQKKGFLVVSYGEGSVTVVFDPKTMLMADWVDVLERTPVRVPKIIAEHMHSPTTIGARTVDIWLKSGQNIDAWLKLDRLLWPWVGRQTQTLKSVLELAMRSLGSLPPPKGLDSNQTKQWASQWKERLKDDSRLAVKDAVKDAPGFSKN